MSIRKILGKVFVCLVLQVGAFSGQVRPEEIEQLMKMMSEPCVTQTVRTGNGDGDGEEPPPVR